MPKRLLDGDRLWHSDKLLQVQPEWIRAEYANLLPLALADGSFECDAHRVWSQVYAYNRPSITVAKVQDILSEFERVKLIFRWMDKEKKQWGFFIGIDKEGLLPPESQRKRYKIGKTPPKDKFNAFINKENDLSLDSIQSESRSSQAGLALGLPLEGLALAETENEMSFKENMGKISWKYFKVTPSKTDSSWAQINSKATMMGGHDKVLAAFEEFCQQHAGDSVPYPLSLFLQVMDGMVEKVETEVTTETDRAKPLILELSFLSDGRVTFNNKQILKIAGLLDTYSEEDITAAFKEFLITLDDYSLKYAAKDFSEKAEQLIYTQRKRKEKTDKINAELERIVAADRAKVAAELAALPDPDMEIEL